MYDDFYKKYGCIDDFVKLKDTDLRGLKERIKLVLKEKGLKQIREANPTLWQDFLGLVEETRHALVHPNPESSAFAKTVDRVFSKQPHSKFPKIASEIIAHFFTTANMQPPDYINNNQLFEIKEIDILF